MPFIFLAAGGGVCDSDGVSPHVACQYAGLRDAAPTGRLRLRDLPAALTSLGSPTAGKGGALRGDAGTSLTDEEWSSLLKAVSRADDKPQLDVNFELFLRAYAEMQLRTKAGNKARDQGIKRSSSSSAAFLTASTTTLLHTISESEKASYVGHINAYLAEDPFLNNALPVDPATDQLFHLTKDGVLLWCGPHQSDWISVFSSHLISILSGCLVQ